MDSGISAAAPAQAVAPAQTTAPPRRLSRLGDELLARYAGRGSERAFAVLYERYHQKLYRYCRSILRDDPDAQDALQATFTSALVALRRDQRNAPLRPWLYRIAHNEAITLLRRRRRQSGEELHPERLGSVASAEQEVADRTRWSTLVEDLGGLSERQRGALLLRELSGLSHEEIAVALLISTAAAKQAIFEARQALAEIEEGRAMSCEDVRRRISEGDRRMLKGRGVRAHLRACSACEAFAAAIPARRVQLMALTPMIPSAAAAMLFTRSLHGAASRGGAGAGTSAAGAGGGSASGAGGTSASGAAGGSVSGAGGGSVATTAGAAKAIGTALVWKGLAGAAVLATAGAGVTGFTLLHHRHGGTSASAAHLSRSASAHSRGASTPPGRSSTGATTRPSGSGHAGRGHGVNAHGAGASNGRGSGSSRTNAKGSAKGSGHGAGAGSGGGHAYGRQGPGSGSGGQSSGSQGGAVGRGGSHTAGRGSAGAGLGLHAGGHTNVTPAKGHGGRSVSVTKHLTPRSPRRRSGVGTRKPSR